MCRRFIYSLLSRVMTVKMAIFTGDIYHILENLRKDYSKPLFFIYNRALLLLTFKALLLFTSCVVEGRLSTNGGGSTLAHNIMWYRFLVLLYYYNSSSKKGGSGCVCTLARDHHF